LRRALGDPDPWVRYLSLKSLGAIGDVSAVPAVTACMQHDPAPHVRLAAIDVVGRLRPAEALEILEPLTRSANDDIVRAATVALGYVDRPEALAELERATRAPDVSRRLAAIEALSLRRELAVPHILQWAAAADDDPAVASIAIEALGALGLREDPLGREATRMLTALTAEPSRRPAAIAALSTLPARRVADIAAGLRHPSIEVRCATLEALACMRHPDASRAIESALDDAAAPVRLTAMAELKHLGTRAAGKKLMALARTDPDARVREAAVMAIARTDRPAMDDAAEAR
jgi:HEAT repeat protein